MTRIPVTDQAFPRWAQSVEDRLKQIRRRIYPQSGVVDALTARHVTTARLVVSDQVSLVVESASTPGAVTGRVMLVDAEGNLVGYLAVYDTIT